MISRRLTRTTLLVAVLAGLAEIGLAAQPANWPEFRGPQGDGHADAPKLPMTWSETENIAWKTPIHDAGWSSPVVWGHQVWVTTAPADGKSLFAVSLDRATGKVEHDVKVFDIEKPDYINPVNSYASPTPLVEAGRLYVHFGTYGTACLDTDSGRILWTRSDLHIQHQMGPGSSLVSAGDLLVFHMDGMDQQYIIALDKATGRTVWKTPRSIDYSGFRPDQRKAFATPAVVDIDGRTQLVSTAGQGAMGYDPRTGEELWKVRFKGWSTVARPVCANGIAFLQTDYDHPQLWAVRLNGHGDVTDTHVVWKVAKHVPSMVSLLLVDDLLYVVSDAGMATCLDSKTGSVVWEQKIGGRFGASPLYAAGRIYLFGRSGATTVIAPGREYRVLATNKLEGIVMASAAVVDNALYLRTDTNLYRIEAKLPSP